MLHIPQVNNCKVGVIFCGGGGINMMRDSIDIINPHDYPNFDFLGTNTDANQLRDKFGQENDARLELWANRLEIHQLGGNTETQGKGAGSQPAVGRRAAQTPESMEALTRFIERHDEIILDGAVGGGTGGGLLPVAAQICLDLEKSAQAIVIMPFPRECREEKAVDGLKAIRTLIPTFCIRNGYLEKFLKRQAKVAPVMLGFEGLWRTINEHSVIPFLLTLREILQVPGDAKNLDQNDHKFVLGHGKSLYLGICRQDKEEPEMKAKAIVAELFAGHFQDTGLFKQVRAVEFWVHGPWDPYTILEVMELIKVRVCESNTIKSIEVHWGMREKVTDDQKWMSVITASVEESEEVETTEPLLVGVGQTEVVTSRTHALRKDEPRRVQIEILVDGVAKTISVDQKLALRYKRVDSKTPESEWRAIQDEIMRTHNMKPELPERFRKTGLMESLRNFASHGREAL